MNGRLPVYLEAGAKRTFACAVDWPGWSRPGREEDEARDALVVYGTRYARAMGRAAGGLKLPTSAADLEVVERVEGGSGTDFGVPSTPPQLDDRPVSGTELRRLTDLLEASWSAVQEAADAAVGVELRKGPRGGGRGLQKILAHVMEGDEAYLREFGGRSEKRDADDIAGRWASVRKALVDAVRTRVGGEPPPPMGRRTRPFWSVRYLIRRSAWHALDHAWEIEDRAAPDPGDA